MDHKQQTQDNSKTLLFVIIYYSLFVLLLFGLGPFFVYLFLDY